MKQLADLKKQQLLTILQNKEIKSVFQPIVNISTGTIYGYEALTRITLENCLFNIEEAFTIAYEHGLLWEFEKLCRSKSLKATKNIPSMSKLFLNIDPNILNDKKFQDDMTKASMKQHHLCSHDIVFEVTERRAIENIADFKDAQNRCTSQGFKIAIDDAGSGYSGLNTICDVSPHYIKIDMKLVRNIHKDHLKKSLVSAIMNFAKEVDVMVIAEGVEIHEELACLMNLGIIYAQGYYLSKPDADFKELPQIIIEEIEKLNHNLIEKNYSPSFFGSIDMLCKKCNHTTMDAKLIDLYHTFFTDETISELPVIDSDQNFLGAITRLEIMRAFGGLYGYSLNSKKRVSDILESKTMIVDEKTDIEIASKASMERPLDTLYDSIAVVSGSKFIGMVSVKELLNAAINIQIKRATDCNPLTGLPGNVSVEKEVKNLLDSDDFFAVAYIDLDNFKAYNDAYGFNNGDLMIKILAKAIIDNCAKQTFKGHIGGDDFVFITRDPEVLDICHKITTQFSEDIKKIYSKSDLERGFIASKNRDGFAENFPLATLSIAITTNRHITFKSIYELSLIVAETKKSAKKKLGNSIIIV